MRHPCTLAYIYVSRQFGADAESVGRHDTKNKKQNKQTLQELLQTNAS